VITLDCKECCLFRNCRRQNRSVLQTQMILALTSCYALCNNNVLPTCTRRNADYQ